MVGYAQTVNAHEVNSGAAAERAFCSPTIVTQQSTPESRGPDDLVDIGQGLKIPTGAWRRIQLQLKDKSICKRAAIGTLGPSRSEGSFASRLALAKVPRSSHQAAPDTVESVSDACMTGWRTCSNFDYPFFLMMTECFKERLVRLGLPVDILQNSVKRLNHFVVEEVG
ncbi:hypothetical protein MTO96_041642 [Rhipicephalus appendiculatus]